MNNGFVKLIISFVCAGVVYRICSPIVDLLFDYDYDYFVIATLIPYGIGLLVGGVVYYFLNRKFPSKEPVEKPEQQQQSTKYLINDPVVLHTENGIVNAFVSKEEDENGQIEIHCLDEYKGELTHTFTHNELDRLTGKIKKPSNTMPMLKSGEPDFMSTTPEQGFNYLFKELGLQPTDAQQLASNKLSAAKDALEEINRQMPQPGTDITNFVNEKKAWQRKADEAQKAVDYWTAVINLSKNN